MENDKLKMNTCEICGNSFPERFPINRESGKWIAGCKPCSRRDIENYVSGDSAEDVTRVWNEENPNDN